MSSSKKQNKMKKQTFSCCNQSYPRSQITRKLNFCLTSKTTSQAKTTKINWSKIGFR